METIRELFSANLKRLRGKRRQEDIAEAVGISVTAYQRLEDGSLPRAETIGKLAKALSVSESEFFQRADAVLMPVEQFIERIRTVSSALSPGILGLIDALSTLDDPKERDNLVVQFTRLTRNQVNERLKLRKKKQGLSST